MNREGKYRIVLIEPSEIVAAGIGAIIDKNPEFSLMQTLSNPGYFNANNSEIDIIIINPAVIDYNELRTKLLTLPVPSRQEELLVQLLTLRSWVTRALSLLPPVTTVQQ